MNEFEVHWSRVRGSLVASQEAAGLLVCAIWPGPVNPDACFEAAGCDHLGDQDERWDDRAAGLLAGLLLELGRYGAPRLVSEPLRQPVPWYGRPFREGHPLELVDQLLEPIHWDSLPACRVEFGNDGVALRVGDGHHIYWCSLPAGDEPTLPEMVLRIAGPYPTHRTELEWRHVYPQRVP